MSNPTERFASLLTISKLTGDFSLVVDEYQNHLELLGFAGILAAAARRITGGKGPLDISDRGECTISNMKECVEELRKAVDAYDEAIFDNVRTRY